MATDVCATGTEFTIVGSTTRSDTNGEPGWFELTEIKLFNAAGENIAPAADSIEIILTSSDDSKKGQINDGKFWFTDADAGFLVWTAATRGGDEAFHGEPLVKLVFSTPQAVTGAELYTTNYESFGTNAQVISRGRDCY